MVEFQASEKQTYKLPNAMTMNELLSEGKTVAQAEQIMHERVFGVGFKKDEHGKPVEQGFGSEANPTPQHMIALKLAEDRKMTKNGGGATADIIAAAVAAGVQAGLAHAAAEAAKKTVAAEPAAESEL